MPRGEYLQYGGQAVVEGVMMRSPRFFSVACRAPNGRIVIQTEAIEKTWIGRQKWLKYPFLRGSLALLDSMALGSRSLKFASNIQLDTRYQVAGPNAEEVKIEPFDVAEIPVPVPVKVSTPASGGSPSPRIQEGAIITTMIVAFFFGVLLFVYTPNLVAEGISRLTHNKNGTTLNLISELVKATIFIGYIAGIGCLPDVREMFKYHGAEHKAINTLEAEQELDMTNCKLQTRLHPRCGTSFAIIVIILGILIFTFLPRYPVTGHQGKNLWLDTSVRVLLELVILPCIAGVAYELLRIAGKFRNQGFVNFFFKPGVWTQYLTTREPNAGQIEVALAALKAVIAAEDAGKVESDEPVVIEPSEYAPAASGV